MEAKTSLESLVPLTALAYCTDLHRQYQFLFLLSRPRRTRLGDFTSRPGAPPRITVNANLNPYNFLITYIHEVAHCVVYREYKSTPRKRIAPHGPEWKQAFARLLVPVMNENVFPADILTHLKKYALNPKASTGADQALYSSIKKYDEPLAASNKIPLVHLTEGSHFVFQNRVFERGLLRRTRVLCTEQKSKRRYTIPAHAMVEKC